jgi:hypothetical protein
VFPTRTGRRRGRRAHDRSPASSTPSGRPATGQIDGLRGETVPQQCSGAGARPMSSSSRPGAAVVARRSERTGVTASSCLRDELLPGGAGVSSMRSNAVRDGHPDRRARQSDRLWASTGIAPVHQYDGALADGRRTMSELTFPGAIAWSSRVLNLAPMRDRACRWAPARPRPARSGATIVIKP